MFKSNGEYFSSTRIAFIAMFSTLAGVLYAFNFAIPTVFPSWLELQFSDIPALIGTFSLGPVSGVIITVVKILIKLLIKSTSTVFVGELADLLIGCAFVVPAGLIYKYHRSFKGALVGMLVGTAASITLSMLFNWLVLVPFYVQLFFGGSWNPILGIMSGIFPSCTRDNFYVLYIFCSVLPFNAIRCAAAVAVSAPLYKRISVLIRKVNLKLAPKNSQAEGETATVRMAKSDVIAISLAAAAVALLVLFALLRYFVF